MASKANKQGACTEKTRPGHDGQGTVRGSSLGRASHGACKAQERLERSIRHISRNRKQNLLWTSKERTEPKIPILETFVHNTQQSHATG